MSDLPEPLSPENCDLRGYEFMPLYGHNLFGSALYTESTDAEFKAALRLWWAAWNQVPAGSLPTSDQALATLADYGRDVKGWLKVKKQALHGFVLCSDGRLYHPMLSAKAVVSFEKRIKSSSKREVDRKRLQTWREKQRSSDKVAAGTEPTGSETLADPWAETPSETPNETVSETPPDTEVKRVSSGVSKRVSSHVESERESKSKKEERGRELTLSRQSDPCDEAVLAWNRMAEEHGLSAVAKLTDQRRSQLKRRLEECGGLDGWDDAMRLVTESAFLLGQRSSWKASFDFVLQPRSFTKLMEGTYGNEGRAESSGRPSNLDWMYRELMDDQAPGEPVH